MKAAVLVGPTAVGKTDLAFDLAGTGFEIVSVDSIQVYRYLDIGSGKPDRELRERVRHHMIDIVDPDYPFTAGEFCRRALLACEEIFAGGKKPLFAGGTGLYVNSFFQGLSQIPPIEMSVRRQLFHEADSRGLASLYEELLSVDNEFARGIHINDKQRILRGLEVFRSTGTPMSVYFLEKTGYESDDTLFIGLYDDKLKLQRRIETRVDGMIKAGFIDEVASLRQMGYGSGLKSMQSIGYSEINEYLDGGLDLEAAIEKIKTGTRRYAKRQMTWFRKNARIRWFLPEQADEIKSLVKAWFNI